MTVSYAYRQIMDKVFNHCKHLLLIDWVVRWTADSDLKNIIIMDADYTLLLSTDFGISWNRITSHDASDYSSSSLLLSSDNVLYGYFYANYLVPVFEFSTDFGLTWRTIPEIFNPAPLHNEFDQRYTVGKHSFLAVTNQGQLFESHDHGATWSGRQSEQCGNHHYRPTCGSVCSAIQSLYLSSPQGECKKAALEEYILYESETVAQTYPLLNGFGVRKCPYPSISYYYYPSWSDSGTYSYVMCKDADASTLTLTGAGISVGTAVSLRVPPPAVYSVAVVLALTFLLCHLFIKDESGNTNYRLGIALFYYTLLPAVDTISNLVVLLQATWGNQSLLICAILFFLLPDIVLYRELWKKCARVKFWFWSMPAMCFFEEYDSFYKIVFTACAGIPYFVANCPFIITWLLLGTFLFKTKVLCIGRVQQFWYRIWTGNSNWRVDVVVDRAQLNEQYLAILCLQSLPWLVLQVCSILIISSSPLTLASLIISALMMLSGLYRYGYYVVYQKRKVIEVPIDMSYLGLEDSQPTTGDDASKEKGHVYYAPAAAGRAQQIVPLNVSNHDEEAGGLELALRPISLHSPTDSSGIMIHIQDLYKQISDLTLQVKSLSDKHDDHFTAFDEQIRLLQQSSPTERN
jgi:hypothetical protein